MANEIGATGSRMLMANLQDRAIQDRSNQRRNSALAAMQADNLNRMAMDPDINDKSLSYFAAAQQADPSGIMGRIAGALGTIRGMEAQEKKNQAVADRRQRTNEYMGSALTDMLGRDLTDVEQAMVNDGKGRSILEMSDLKQRMEDADYARRMREKQDIRDEEAYQKQLAREADLKKSLSEYASSLPEDSPTRRIMMMEGLSDEQKAKLMTEEIAKTASKEQIRGIIDEMAPILESIGMDREAYFAQQMGYITPNMATLYSQHANAIVQQPEYLDSMRALKDSTARYMEKVNIAQQNVLNTLVPIELAEDALRQEGGYKVGGEPADFQSQVDARHRAMKMDYLNNKENVPIIQQQVDAMTASEKMDMDARYKLISQMREKNPYISRIYKFRKEDNMNRMLSGLPEGTVFQSPNNNYFKVGVGPDGQNIRIEATDEDVSFFRDSLYGFYQPSEEQPVVGADEPINNLPTPGQLNDTDIEENVDRSTPENVKTAEEIESLYQKYDSLLKKAAAKGAKEEAKISANETGFGTALRGMGDLITRNYANSLILPYEMIDGFVSHQSNPISSEVLDSLKYAGVQDYMSFQQGIADVGGIDALKTPTEKNILIKKELQRRIKLLEKAQ